MEFELVPLRLEYVVSNAEQNHFSTKYTLDGIVILGWHCKFGIGFKLHALTEEVQVQTPPTTL